MKSPNSEEMIFCEALDVPAEERAMFLQRACKGNVELMNSVKELLQLHDTEASFLATPAMGISHIGAVESPGDRIGCYQLDHKIGEGGFGIVWQARQLEPIKRNVALKIVKLGMNSQSIVQRFGEERQTLALMNHPNIATVLDAGVTQSGRPFFAMELVEGESIDRFCTKNQLGVVEQLQLFVTVCRAIQHAHQKGIVHLDLKPSNILIATNENQLVPKIIDFGIATAVQTEPTDGSPQNSKAGLAGTPQYMSPEQWSNKPGIDTRSDIFSLGVVLYRLLSGSLPADGKHNARKELPKLPRMLGYGSGAANTSTEDLDWIISKATDEEPDGRYQSASELAIDIERFLAGQPVVANPGSAGYALKKFVSRNKVAVGSLLLTLLALLAGICASTLGWVYANEQRAIADLQKEVAQENEKEAIRLKEIAEAEATKLRVVANVLKNILPEASPFRGMKSGFQIREHLDELINSVDSLSSEPELEADLRVTAARVYENLSRYGRARLQYSKALQIRKEALGEEHPKTLLCLAGMAACNIELGRLRRAEEMITEVLEKSEGNAPRNHINALRTLRKIRDEQQRYVEAFEIAEQCKELSNRVFRNEIFGQIHVANEYSMSAIKIGMHEEAEKIVRNSLNVLERDHPERKFVIANTKHRLAEVLLESRKLDEAKKHAADFVAMQKMTLGENDKYVVRGLALLSEIYWRDGDFQAAETFAKEAVARAETHDPDQLKVRRTAYRRLAMVLAEVDWNRSVEQWEKTIEIGWELLGGDIRVASDLMRQARIFEKLDKLESAASRVRRAIEILENRKEGMNRLPGACQYYAELLGQLDHPELAKEYFEKAKILSGQSDE